MESKSNILPVESDHADAARYAIERKRMEQALQESERRYRGLVEMSREAILIHSQGKLVFVSDAAAGLFGASAPEQLIGRSFLDFVHPKSRDAVTEYSRKLAAQGPSTPFVKYKLIRLDGAHFDAEVAASHCSHGGKPALQLVVRRVAVRRRIEHHLSYPAQYDLLTQLPNRTQFRDRLVGTLARASRNKQEAAIVFLDLDHFKRVNTALGQATGDLVLKELAERLKHCIREGDTVARLGGDEFSLILEGVSDKHGATVVGQRLLEAVSLPVLIDGQQAHVTASIGITVYPLDADEIDRLWRNADVAMHFAKDCGGNNYQFYAPELDARSRRDELGRAEVAQRLARLTPREREVLDMLVAGKANKMVAYLLGISTRTIDNHRASIMDKMQADSLPELVRMRLDLVAPDPGPQGAGHLVAAGA